MKSLPVRGAWIEIALSMGRLYYCKWSLPVRGAWIEMFTGAAKSA